MSVLASLKLVEFKPLPAKPVLNRRRRLIAKIEEQIRLMGGNPPVRPAAGKAGKVGAEQGPGQVTPWWYEQLDGKVILTVRFNGRPLEFTPGKSAIECESVSVVAHTLALIRQAVVDGELDDLLDPKRRSGEKTGIKKGAAKR